MAQSRKSNMIESKPPEAAPVPDSPNPPAPPPKEQLKTLEDLIQEKAPEILDSIPAEDRPKLAKVTIEQTRISYRSGMLPEPSELAAYNAIIPNGAERIMKMAETQSAHRIELEKTVVESQQKLELRGQWFGLIIALAFGFGGLYAAVHGQPWFGGILAGGTLVSLVGIFVYSKKQSQKELSEKRQNMMPQPMPRKASQNKPTRPEVQKL